MHKPDSMNSNDIKTIALECLSDICDVQKLVGEAEHDAAGYNKTKAMMDQDLAARVDQDGSLQALPSQHVIGLILLYASWNQPLKRIQDATSNASSILLSKVLETLTWGLKDCQCFVSSIQIDDCEESISFCIGDNEFCYNNKIKSQTSNGYNPPLPPSELPTLAVVYQNSSMSHSILRYISVLRSCTIIDEILTPAPIFDRKNQFYRPVRTVIQQLETEFHLDVTAESCQDAIRLFVAGDKSSVGKSSVCLGLLGTLLQQGMVSSDQLTYIKPATQSESPQLIEHYCRDRGIDCVPVGPLVYYRGFTRAYLAGETLDTDQLLDQCRRAVDRLARHKKIVLIDGVGFPAVGSICGTDNACVARACSYPKNDNSHGDRTPLGVVLVGGPGVGAAVDAFNLNATYFAKYHIPVLGAIFNKLELTGFYSLESCRSEVTTYFDHSLEQVQQNRRPFGFVPLFPQISGPNAMGHVEDFIRLFADNVDVSSIVSAAQRVKELRQATVSSGNTSTRIIPPSAKRQKSQVITEPLPLRSRQEIEIAAIEAGAAPSA